MNRVHYGRKRWRTRWPWNRLFPLRIDDRFCTGCGLPYHNGPLPKEVEQFTVGDVGAAIYPAGSWRGRSLAVRFGRWKAGAGGYFLSDYIGMEELDELDRVIELTRDFIEERRETSSTRRQVLASVVRSGFRAFSG